MSKGCRVILETDGAFSTHSFHLEKHRELTNALGEDPVRILASKILALLRCGNLKRGTRVPKLNSKLCYQDVTCAIFIILVKNHHCFCYCLSYCSTAGAIIAHDLF